jgi:hypothetical protein
MMNMDRARYPIIGLTGRARSGKSTAAEYLLRVGVGKYAYSFADPLKAMIKAGFGIDLDHPWWQMRKEDPIADFAGFSPRALMQTLGTEWGRTLVHRDIWVSLANRELQRRGDGMVIADVRFDNEAIWVRRRGGVVVHLERGSAPAVRPHVSEAGVQRLAADIRVFNESSVESLHAQLDKLFHVKESA